MNWRSITLALIGLLLCIQQGIAATPPSGYAITHTITVQEDGMALWQVEYRTLLTTQDEVDVFENSSQELQLLLQSQFKDLMERSATQASVATSRPMEITNFSSDSLIQTSPMGRYGVIRYSFDWIGFAHSDSDLTIGDAFIGGMYLDKDTTLILRYPPGYSVKMVEPPSDQVNSGLIWYGLRSFGGGEPRVVLEPPQGLWFPLIAVLIIAALTGGGYLIFLSRRQDREPEGTEEKIPPPTEMELLSLEERIVHLLQAHREGMFQSDIVKNLGLPKSTVSSTLNDLHRRGLIQKVRKGKENLIRLV
jgi:hypothetical protein